jgi:integrase
VAVFRFRNSWKAEVFVDGRRVKTKCFKRKQDGERWHDETKARLRNEPFALQALSYHFEDLVRKFSDAHLSTVRPETAKRYSVDLQRRIAPYFRYRKLSSITSEMIEEFKRDISKDLGGKSINNCLHTLRLMLNKAVKWKMLSESPYSTDSVKIPRNHNYQWWDKKEYIATFLRFAKAKTKYWPAYVLALETGMRIGEVIGLNIEDVDFKRGRIRVWRQWHNSIKKFGPCKHDIERFIDFVPHGPLHKALLVATGERKEGPVFITTEGNRALKGKIADIHFRRILRSSGVPPIKFHGLRHTYASWYMSDIGDTWSLMHNLGHGDVRTTQMYAHHAKEHRRPILSLTDLVTHNSLTVLDGGLERREESRC